MVFFNKFFTPYDEIVAAPEGPVLELAPAVLRISMVGKDADVELDALAAAVAKMNYPASFTNEQVFAAATELLRMIRISGVEGLAETMRAELDPAAQIEAMQLALTAVFCSPLRDSGDIGVLAGLASRIDMSRSTFEGLFETAKAAA